jgi:hypothetical protein
MKNETAKFFFTQNYDFALTNLLKNKAELCLFIIEIKFVVRKMFKHSPFFLANQSFTFPCSPNENLDSTISSYLVD